MTLNKTKVHSWLRPIGPPREPIWTAGQHVRRVISISRTGGHGAAASDALAGAQKGHGARRVTVTAPCAAIVQLPLAATPWV
jgi:hypothetical protein